MGRKGDQNPVESSPCVSNLVIGLFLLDVVMASKLSLHNL